MGGPPPLAGGMVTPRKPGEEGPRSSGGVTGSPGFGPGVGVRKPRLSGHVPPLHGKELPRNDAVGEDAHAVAEAEDKKEADGSVSARSYDSEVRRHAVGPGACVLQC